MSTSTLEQMVRPTTAVASPPPAAPVRLPQPPARAHKGLICFALAALLGYAVWNGYHFSSGYGGADTSGYINSARLLAEGELTAPIHGVPELGEESYRYCVPLGFARWRNTAVMAPNYPVGLPTLLALSGLVAGWHWGPLLLYTCGAMLTLFFCYASSREMGAAPIWSVLGAAMFACSPLLIWSSQEMMSDGVSATWSAAAFYAALRGRRSQRAAACCGVAFVLDVMIRPTNFLILPALVVVLQDRKKLAAACLGGLPLAIALGWYNTTLWGEPWRTGYGKIRNEFQLASFGPTLAYYAVWIPHLLPVGALGLLSLPFLNWRSNRRELLGLALWSFSMIGFYAFYPLTRIDWWWLRYILPAFPALVILGTIAIDRIASSARHGRPLFAGFVSIALVVVSYGLSARDWTALHLCDMTRSCDLYMAAADWVQENTPDNAIISTLHLGGTLLFRDRIVIRWDQLTPTEWNTVAESARENGRPIYLMEWPAFIDEALEKKTPGAWKKLSDVAEMRVWQLSAN